MGVLSISIAELSVSDSILARYEESSVFHCAANRHFS